jgi:hypothetical protein
MRWFPIVRGGRTPPGVAEGRRQGEPSAWEVRMSPAAESGTFTRNVAPVLIAFTMPTVALIATSKDWPQLYAEYADSWRVATLSLFMSASGFFLAGVQLIDGDLIPRWCRVRTAAVRAVLTYLGLIFLGGALAMLVLPSMRPTPWVPATIRWVADRWSVSLVVLGLGVIVPILLRVGWWVLRLPWVRRRLRSPEGCAPAVRDEAAGRMPGEG